MWILRYEPVTGGLSWGFFKQSILSTEEKQRKQIWITVPNIDPETFYVDAVTHHQSHDTNMNKFTNKTAGRQIIFVCLTVAWFCLQEALTSLMEENSDNENVIFLIHFLLAFSYTRNTTSHDILWIPFLAVTVLSACLLFAGRYSCGNFLSLATLVSRLEILIENQTAEIRSSIAMVTKSKLFICICWKGL